MNAERVGPNRIRIPRRAEGAGGVTGDGYATIGPDDPEYAQWAAWVDRDSAPDVDRSARP